MPKISLKQIAGRICYTDLVYKRVNKKLHQQLNQQEIEKMVQINILQADQSECCGKNLYIFNLKSKLRLTINRHNFRLITIDRLSPDEL